MHQSQPENSAFSTRLVVLLLIAGILLMGFLAYAVVGDRGQPTWDYRPVKDVPGESSYARYQALPYPQHVRGAKGE
jgi:hypothetical protein